MKSTKVVLGSISAAMMLVAAGAQGQTLAFSGTGSSALFLELGTGAATGPAVGATCVWSAGNNATSGLKAVDSRVSPAASENGQSFIAWTPAGGSCAAPGSGSQVYSFVQEDSTVGDRCYFASPKCTIQAQGTSPVGSAPANLILASGEVALPASIFAVVNNQAVTAAATDIRPEDAKFATLRALTPCQQFVLGAPFQQQYLGLGYQTGTTGVGTQIKSFYSTAAFNVLDFNLTGTDPITGQPLAGSFSTLPVGAAPIVVAVNPGPGFSNAAITNLTLPAFAAFLSGAEARTQDAISSTSYQNVGPGNAVTVLEREPLSGTYNTTEYASANTISFKSSQDVGVNQVPTAINCNGATVGSNPMHLQNSTVGNGSFRNRVIGTGEMVKTILATSDSLGYAFWSVPNFKAATAANAKYLTIDGIDPIQTTYTGGVLPTPTNGNLGNVTLANVANGNYPIWSTLRVVTSNPAPAGVTALIAAAQQQVSFGTATSNPDFVPFTSLQVVHSHFQPTGVNFPSTGGNNASNGTCALPEAGGDVAGAIFTKQIDGDFCADFGLQTGFTNFRK